MKNGFTLIKVMIIFAIFGILAAVAIPSWQDYQSSNICGDGKGKVGSNPSDERCVEWNKRLISRFGPKATTSGTIPPTISAPAVAVAPTDTVSNAPQPELPTPATGPAPAHTVCIAGYLFLDSNGYGSGQVLSKTGGGVPCN